MTRTVTVRLENEMFERLESAVIERRKKTGEAASKADIIREALDGYLKGK